LRPRRARSDCGRRRNRSPRPGRPSGARAAQPVGRGALRGGVLRADRGRTTTGPGCRYREVSSVHAVITSSAGNTTTRSVAVHFAARLLPSPCLDSEKRRSRSFQHAVMGLVRCPFALRLLLTLSPVMNRPLAGGLAVTEGDTNASTAEVGGCCS